MPLLAPESSRRGGCAHVATWDEIVGHALCFVGLTVLVVAVAHSGRPLPLPGGAVPRVLAAVVGGMWGRERR